MDRKCRICMAKETEMSLVDIFSYALFIGDTELYLYEALQELTKLKISENDGKSEVICPVCEARIHDAYELKILAEESDRKFSEEIEKWDTGLEQKTTIDQSENIVAKENEEEEKPIEEDAEKEDATKEDIEEIDAVSFVLKNIPNEVAKAHEGDDIREGRKTVNYKDRKHECHVCSKRFFGRSNLKVHLRIHTKERPYECEYCGKTFYQSYSHKTHLRVHTKERPYKCKVCQKTYRHLGSLSYHIRTHTGEKNYVCPVCGKRFSTSSILAEHKDIHDNVKYKCYHCSKDFTNKGSIKRHIRIHRKDIQKKLSGSQVMSKKTEF